MTKRKGVKKNCNLHKSGTNLYKVWRKTETRFQNDGHVWGEPSPVPPLAANLDPL